MIFSIWEHKINAKPSNPQRDYKSTVFLALIA